MRCIAVYPRLSSLAVGGGTRKEVFSPRKLKGNVGFTVAHKSTSNKIRKARGEEQKKVARGKRGGGEKRRSKAKPRDEFIHGWRGVERG